MDGMKEMMGEGGDGREVGRKGEGMKMEKDFWFETKYVWRRVFGVKTKYVWRRVFGVETKYVWRRVFGVETKYVWRKIFGLRQNMFIERFSV
jgi:hypothetical protein